MERTIAAIATPIAVGGISVIRISGPDAISAADRVFRPVSGRPLAMHQGYTAAYGDLYEGDQLIDDGVALVFRAPKSYTGEDVVELSCHGGLLVTQKVLRAILKQNVFPAEAGEFTKRAFLNGKLTLTQAEAVADVISAGSSQALRFAKEAMRGKLYQKIRGVIEMLTAVSGHLSAYIDYPEEDIDGLTLQELRARCAEAQAQLQELLVSFDRGRLLREGVDTVIVGKPNVGKSTLMNLLAGCEKSIVTDIAGTTRDVVEETVNLGDVVLRLADTAGIHETDHPVERVGVELAVRRLESASLILAVFDGSQPLSEEDFALIERVRPLPCVAICNKSDLQQQLDLAVLKQEFPHLVVLSAREQQGVSKLNREVLDLLALDRLSGDQAILFNERQHNCAMRADQALSEVLATIDAGYTLDAVDVAIESVLSILFELSGERVTDAVVQEVFSHFCVGK